jgi:adenosylmethionine-8-amino-7-oxononanoate aminotransferase
MNFSSLITKDLQHVWHPCSIMKNFEEQPPLVVTSAHGSYIETNQGRLIDGISSWWCKALGQGHPTVLAGIRAQLERFEHVMPANTTHDNLVMLAEEMTKLSGKQHIFFASDGSCAVEIALKLAIQATRLKGHPHRNQVLALRHAYHGETLGALSVSDMGIYKESWAGMGINCQFLDPIPYVNHPTDPLWHDATEAWAAIRPQLERASPQACALIIEPVIQGANGLRPYSADFLSKLVQYAKEHDIYVIADEIMTGLGRTGTWLASEYASIDPDMICLSKGLTSGSIPMSCVLIDHAIYDLFYQETEPSRHFLHSHTYSGNALAIAAALATIQTMQKENILKQAQDLGTYMQTNFQAILQSNGHFSPIRSLGAIVAADYQGPNSAYFSRALSRAAQQFGALLRPIGPTLYWFPPLNTSHQTIDELTAITEKAIHVATQEIESCTV